jgi:hypothetical protein
MMWRIIIDVCQKSMLEGVTLALLIFIWYYYYLYFFSYIKYVVFLGLIYIF